MAQIAHNETRLVAGCMTGTSIDALDAALVEIEGTGLTMQARLVGMVTEPLGDLAPRLRSFAEQAPLPAGEMASLSRAFSLLHARAVTRLKAHSPGRTLALIAAHGQTVFHAPPVSFQMLSPAVIAAETGVDVWSDLRSADLAAGGQGAPITPLADFVLLRSEAEKRVVVNLGGFCNLTLLRPLGIEGPAPGAEDLVMAGEVRFGVGGRDVCACNHLLDTVARRVLGVPFDGGGQAALAGHVDDEALDDLLGVLVAQGAAKRSLGTGDEAMGWVGRHRSRVSGPDLAATACEAIGQRIAAAVTAQRVILAGGGVRNAALVAAISSCCSAKVDLSDVHGVPAPAREAMAMAVLGALCADGVPITLGAVTGRQRASLAGTLTRGG